MAVTASNLRVTPAIAAMQRAPRTCRAAAVVRGGCASSSGAPAHSSAKLSARRAVAGGAAAHLARESRLSLALRAPARARTSVVRSAHASVSSPRPRGTRAAPSRPRGPSLSVAIFIRGALSELVRSERHRRNLFAPALISAFTHHHRKRNPSKPTTDLRVFVRRGRARGAGHRRRGAPGVRPQGLAEIWRLRSTLRAFRPPSASCRR